LTVGFDPGLAEMGVLVTEILVDVRPAVATGDISRRHSVLPESFALRAGEITATIAEVAGKLRDSLDEEAAKAEAVAVREQPAGDQASGWRLDTVELAFELSLQAEAGVVITRASTEATFSVTLTWNRGDGK
jgi:hypothetical protein